MHGPLSLPSPRVLAAALALAACHAAAPAAPPQVVATQPTQREVTDSEDFTGRLVASETVELRARVAGYLDKVDCKPGSDVKQGDVLFEIDPRPYQAVFDLARANVQKEEASLALAKAVYQADKAAANAVSKEQLAQDLDAVAAADAALKAAEAGAKVAQLNLDFTKVTAPVAGRVSRPDLDCGNLVQADTTRLGVLVAVDPINVAFDVDEHTFLRLPPDLRAGKGGEEGKAPLQVGLSGEEGLLHQARLTGFDGRVDATTGVVRAWGVLANPDGLLLPGQFARVRMPLGKPHPALLVPDASVLHAQGEKYLFTMDDKNRVRRTPVKVGALHDGLREIRDGLNKDSWVVVEGAAALMDGDEVQARRKDKQ